MKDDLTGRPLVSVVMAAFNGQSYLSEAIESVINQTYQHWELIIVNDGSTDETLTIARSLEGNDGRITVINLPKNIGPAKARNSGISKALGRYIAFLDADDIWMPKKLDEQIAFMQANDCVLCFSGYEKVNKLGCFVGSVGVPSKVSYRELLKTNVIGCLTGVYDAEYFGKAKMPLIRKRQDYGFWLMLLKRVKFAYGINEPLAKYRVHGSSLTYRKQDVARYTWRIFREFEKLPTYQCVYYFSHYAVRGILRNNFPRIAVALGVLDVVK